MINGLDVVILFILAVAIGVGFIGGVVRIVALTIALYLGSVAAGRWYIDLTAVAHRHVNNFGVETGQFVIFAGLLTASALFLTPLIERALGRLRLPRRLEIADNVGGAVMGVAAAALIVLPMSIVLVALNQTVGGAFISGAHGQVEHSALAPVFLRIAPLFVRALSPWFPGGLPPILTVVR